MQRPNPDRPVRDIATLRRGDQIEARRGDSACHRGQVKDTAPGVGMIWLYEQGRRGRKAVSADDYSIYRIADHDARTPGSAIPHSRKRRKQL